MTKQQREYMLRQQMRAIQEELGEKSPEKAEVDELRRRLTEADLPDEVRKEAERELTPAGADAGRRAGFSGDAHLSGIGPGTAVEEGDRRHST